MGLTLGSLFDGIGGWLSSAIDYGIKPLWSSEVERFPLAVTKHHYPDVQQVGDIRNLDGGGIAFRRHHLHGQPMSGLIVGWKKRGVGWQTEWIIQRSNTNYTRNAKSDERQMGKCRNGRTASV